METETDSRGVAESQMAERGRRTAAAPARLGAPSADFAERIVVIARSWIGTPYVHQASLKGVGCDCLGLLRGVWRELYGEEPQDVPPYSPDWAEATGAETLYMALSRHLTEIPKSALSPGDIALFRMVPRGPAKHCGIIAQLPHSPFMAELHPPVGAEPHAPLGAEPHPPRGAELHPPLGAELHPPLGGGSKFANANFGEGTLTLIHARQNKRVSEEPYTTFWRQKLTRTFRI